MESASTRNPKIQGRFRWRVPGGLYRPVLRVVAFKSMTAYRLRDRLANMARKAIKREAARLQKTIVEIVEAAGTNGGVSDHQRVKTA